MESILLVSLKLDKYKADMLRLELGYVPNEIKNIILKITKGLEEEAIKNLIKTHTDYKLVSVYKIDVKIEEGLIRISNSRRIY